MNEQEINELLSKIQELEDKNEQMRKKIKDKKKENQNFGNNKNVNTTQNKKFQKEKKITPEDDRKASLRFKNEINFLNNNSLQIKDNLVEKIIEFVPEKDYGAMYIMGDFNGWEPEIMRKDKEVFSFKVVLIKGFKYYYSFHSNEETIIDYNNTYEENPVNLQIQNFIDLYQNKNEKTNYFDYKTDSNILKSAQRNYLLLKINDDIENTLFLEKFQRHMLLYKQFSNISEELKIKDSLELYYDNLIKKADLFDSFNLQSLKSEFINRILIQNSPIMEKVQYQYKIIDFAKDDNYMICMRLYDHNQIKLNNKYYSDIENCWKLPFDEIVLKPINDRDKLYHLLTAKESEKIIKDFENDTENIITAYFKDLDNLNINSKSITRKYGKKNDSGDLVKPNKIEPDDVELNDYEYYYLNGEINKIRNKDDNSYVEYKVVEENKKNRIKKEVKEIKETKEIKEEKKISIVEKNDKKEQIDKKEKINEKKIIEKKELIQKQKKPTQFSFFYTFYNNQVIILHCHLFDKSFKYKKINIKEIQNDIDPHILKKDKLYINSNELLLITNSTGPIKLYFKGKKVQMESKLIETNKLYKIESSNGFNSIFHQMIVSPVNLKNNKTLQYELLEQCNSSVFKGKDILNGIDVKVENNNSFDEDMLLAVSPCLLKNLTPEEENNFKNTKNNKKIIKKSYEIQKFELIEREMNKYRKYNKDMINKMSQSEKDNIAITLDDYKSTMDVVCAYIQENELWDMIEKVSSITNEIENLLTLFDN